MKSFNINNLFGKTVQKNSNDIYLANLVTALNSHCKKVFIADGFDSRRKSYNVVKFFFIFLFISYTLCFVLQDISNPIRV